MELSGVWDQVKTGVLGAFALGTSSRTIGSSHSGGHNVMLLTGVGFGLASALYILYGPSPAATRKGRRSRSFKNGRSGSESSPVVGLVNYGNQCFINAVLQSLAPCSTILNWLKYHVSIGNEAKISPHAIELDRHSDEEVARLKPLSTTLLKTLKILNKSNNFLEPASPIAVLNALRAHRWLISNEQQDAYELFNVLTSTLDAELTASLPLYSFKDILLIEQLGSLPTTPACEQVPPPPRRCASGIGTRSSPTTPLEPCFLEFNQIPKALPTRGMLASQLQCRKCRYKYPVHLDTFDTISLAIPSFISRQPSVGAADSLFSAPPPVLLQDCLNKFVSNEVIHEVTCEGCCRTGNKSDFVKKLTFAKLPQLLCFHIQRLVWLPNGILMKRSERVSFPEYLIMDEYMYTHRKGKQKSSPKSAGSLIGGQTPTLMDAAASKVISNGNSSSNSSDAAQNASSSPPNPKYVYSLRSVIVHLGDATSGHFIAYRRGSGPEMDTNWFYTSDSDVIKVSLQEVLRSSVYMVFYERVKSETLKYVNMVRMH